MGPEAVIKPLLAPWLGLGGNGFLGCFSLRVTNAFLEGHLFFPLTFLLGAPFLITLAVDKDVPSFPFSFSSFLRVAANTLTDTIILAASISVRGV